MSKVWSATLLLSLLAGVMVEVIARIAAHLAVAEGSPSLPTVLGDTFASVWTPLPVVLAAAFSAWAAHIRSARAVVLVLPLALSPHAYWTYMAERGSILALAERKWTAAALGPAFAWVFSVVLVTVAGTLGVFLAAALYDYPIGRSPSRFGPPPST